MNFVSYDCCEFPSPFKKKEGSLSDWKALDIFVKCFQQECIWNFSANEIKKNIDFNENPFATFDYKSQKWYAGRWVGTQIKDKNTFTVNPRFGILSLVSMFDEIFSTNILDNLSDTDKNDSNGLFQVLFPLLWAKKLGDANKYGVPRTSVDVIHKGQGIKGRLLVRKSILPFFREKAVVSATREKQVDATVCRIILQAYQTLNKRFSKLTLAKLSDNALNAIESFESAQIPEKRVTQLEYETIQYKSIYQSWKDVVDFSWEIINGLAYGQKESDSKQGFSLFIDMAEIWEMYLRSLLRHQFPDWRVRTVDESTIETYPNQFFGRKIIPDIIMERGDEVMIFDAKWKRMKFNQKDVDRGDFFQIHTYMQYFHTLGKTVKVGGLLYPISTKSEEMDARTDLHSPSFFGLDTKNMDIPFIVDGICFGDEQSLEDKTKNLTAEEIENHKNIFTEQVNNFIERIQEFAN